MFNDELQKRHYQIVIEKHVCTSDSMRGAAYPTSCKRRTNMTGQDHAGRRICAGQYIHADEAAKSRNKIFPRRSTIIALGHLY